MVTEPGHRNRQEAIAMTRTSYPPDVTLAAARAQYFAANHFGSDGGYDDPFVDFKLGPIPFPFPNTEGRRRAVRYHDLHHILTGYDTDFTGELEISAWELAAGCRDFWAAWMLNLGGTAMGALVAPRRTFRAFVRGRRSRTLYGQPLGPLLDRTVAEARRDCLPANAPSDATAGDLALFAAAYLAGSLAGWMFLSGVAALLPVALVTLFRKRRMRAPRQA
jgi:hypothetical protein